MSKNFELLHNISNEKDLFQTLDGWEEADEGSVNVGAETELDGTLRATTTQQSPLPDVLQAVNDTLDSLELVAPDLSRDQEPSQKPIKEPSDKKAHVEGQSPSVEDRFPISRDPIKRVSSDLDIPQAWIKPEIEPNPGNENEVELELEPETLPNIAISELLAALNKNTSSNDTKVQEPRLAEEKKAHHESMPSPSFRSSGVGRGNAAGESRARKGRTSHPYRDPRLEAIAHEEELKLVQRVFLAGEDSPRMVLFSGFERDIGCASICIHACEILAAQTESSICLVDMGFRAPSLHEYCEVQNTRGLAEAIVETGPIQEFAQQLSPANLWAIPSGRGASQLNFAKVADRLRNRLEELRNAYRHVVVHSGSLWLNADAMLIGKWTDGVVLILEAHSTRRDTARRIKESLAVANTKVLGVVLNNRTYPIPETLYSRL